MIIIIIIIVIIIIIMKKTEKKRQYTSRVLEVEQATFTPLVFSTTGGMAAECKRYHSRLAELLATKTGESYATTMSWIRARVSFALLRSALLCLRGWRTKRRSIQNCWTSVTLTSKRTCKYLLKTSRTIFYFLLFIVFCGRFPYLKVISYSLLSYLVFWDNNVDSEGLKFSCNKQ